MKFGDKKIIDSCPMTCLVMLVLIHYLKKAWVSVQWVAPSHITEVRLVFATDHILQ